MKSYKKFLKFLNEQRERVVFGKPDTTKYSVAVYNYIQNPDFLKGSNNRLIRLFADKEGNDFSVKFIDKLRNQIANNNIALREIIFPRIVDVFDDAIQNFDSDEFEIMKEDIGNIKQIINKINAKDLYSNAICQILKCCADWIFDEDTIREILIRMYYKNIEGFIAEYTVKKWLKEVKNIQITEPSYIDDVYKGIDFFINGQKFQVKSIRKDENAYIGEIKDLSLNSSGFTTFLELKNSSIQLDEKSLKARLDGLYFVTPKRIIVVKTKDIKIDAGNYSYMIFTSSVKENVLETPVDYDQNLPEFAEIKEIIQTDQKELGLA